MKHFFNGYHRFINLASFVVLGGYEKRSHFPLPLRVYVPALHFRQRMLEIGRFQISDQESVGPQEQGIIVPAGLAEGAKHLRPDLAMPVFIFFQLLRADVQ